MILKVSDSHDDTVDMFWRLRRLAGAPARWLRAARLIASYVRLSDAQLEDIGLNRADIDAAARAPAADQPAHLADAYMRRQPFSGLLAARRSDCGAS
jgi:uncharacterized protein YjiS (DUF1127 family)